MGGNIGVLALQGAFFKHAQTLEMLSTTAVQVRYETDLAACDGLIIPGGESTAISFHIKENGLLEPLKNFARTQPIFGTCAGMILMAKTGILPLLDITVARNAYGRQRDSFSTDLDFMGAKIHALFIRAPRITAILNPNVQILAEYNGEPVLIQQNMHMAAAFHPELTNVSEIHKYFIELCKKKQ